MRSPRFDIRAKPLRSIFSPSNLERVWKKKVRISMRQQFLNDGVENFDFHVANKQECSKLSRLILEGSYVPQRAQRILVEKGKGLCRQLVIPSVRDALVLQCLSDALYNQIKGKAPTDRSFFEPKEHRFSASRSEYGTFASWLNFQRELFSFSKNRRYVVITDIANYYDTISYGHLRNIIASITDVEESVLDMLIYVLSDLLWQPDYAPRVEVGLPQANLDAPRLLAHCFLYELDEFLASDPNKDFVRYMDDIDIGVDTIIEAKKALKSVDLVLQTKQVRLNSGKTKILTSREALAHFRIVENARLDNLQERVDRRLAAGLAMDRERKVVRLRLTRGLKSGAFDAGNGEKVLKRYITLASKLKVQLPPNALEKLIRLRPSVRENVLAYIRSQPLTPARAKAIADVASSGWLVDDAALVDISNYLVETRVEKRSQRKEHIERLISATDGRTYYGLYCGLWLRSKYASVDDLMNTIMSNRPVWLQHERLGRLVGAFTPLFRGTSHEKKFRALAISTANDGIRQTFRFHWQLAKEKSVFDDMYASLSNLNPSRGTSMTHAKFLCLLSALENDTVPIAKRNKLRAKTATVFDDVYYRATAKRLGIY